MTMQKIDHQMALMHPKGGSQLRSMSTALVVGEEMELSVNVSGVDLLFALKAKSVEDLVEFKRRVVDNVKIGLTISTESGRGARVRVQAPDSVRIKKPAKAAV